MPGTTCAEEGWEWCNMAMENCQKCGTGNELG